MRLSRNRPLWVGRYEVHSMSKRKARMDLQNAEPIANTISTAEMEKNPVTNASELTPNIEPTVTHGSTGIFLGKSAPGSPLRVQAGPYPVAPIVERELASASRTSERLGGDFPADFAFLGHIEFGPELNFEEFLKHWTKMQWDDDACNADWDDRDFPSPTRSRGYTCILPWGHSSPHRANGARWP